MNKTFAIILTVLVVAACRTQDVSSGVAVIEWNMYSVSEYCGGAEPTEDLLKELETPKPFSDTLYLHKPEDFERKDSSIVVIFKKGTAKLIGVPPGEYVVFAGPIVNKDSVMNLSEYLDCKIMTNNMPVYQVLIPGTSSTITDTIMLRCDPCLPPME